MNPLRFLHSLFLSHSLTSVSAKLAAARENLEELEDYYAESYPTDETVEKILASRREADRLERKLENLRLKRSKLS